MPECVRCGVFTDNTPDGDYHYCDDCLDRFTEVEQSGVIVEQDTSGEAYHVIVTDGDASLDGGTEYTQVEALARGKHIADECGLEGLFKYAQTGSTWILSEYLEEHPSIRQDVHERLRRLPEDHTAGFLSRIRQLL